MYHAARGLEDVSDVPMRVALVEAEPSSASNSHAAPPRSSATVVLAPDDRGAIELAAVCTVLPITSESLASVDRNRFCRQVCLIPHFHCTVGDVDRRCW